MKTIVVLFLLSSLLFCGNAVAQTDQKLLLGEWVGKIQPAADISINVVFRYELDKDGKYVAFLDSPDQGAKGIPIADLVFDGKQLSFKVPAVQAEYSGQLAGESISGTFKQLGRETALNFTKGKFVAAANQLDIPAEAMNTLLGRWTGKIGPLSIVFRFEQNAEGKPTIFLDSPDQGASGIPITKASLKDNTLSLGVPAIGGEFSGKLSGNIIDGTWTQMGNRTPLILTKEQAVK
jgi:serine-type D-Ala-D-Ala carboxypeptidase/endopeptidase